MGTTCGSLSLLKYYPKSQLWPPTPFSSSSSSSSSSSIHPNLRFPSINSRPRRRTQIQLGFNYGENDQKGNASNYFEDIKDRFRRRRWWSEEEEDSTPDQPPGILDQIIDSSYILKALSSYGWGLPIILLSILIASGPKAFLMSMAFPIGESAITFTFKKLSSTTRSSSSSSSSAAPKRKTKTYKKKKKNKPQPKSANLEVEDEMDEKQEQGQNSSNFRGWD